MFGKNPIRPPEKGDGSILFVQEIFPTLQGEGPLAGVPAVFLRLGGCNLACSFCDTEFESFKEWKLEDIIAEVKKLSLPPLPLRERAGVRGYTENTLEKASQLRRNQTPAERALWRLIRNKQLSEFKFRRQQPIGSFIVDFFCSEANLIIEMDGDTHGAQTSYDESRTQLLRNMGYRVIRFWNNDVLQNPEGVFMQIEAVLRTPPLAPPSGGGEKRELVVITGGEPFRQPIEKLCEALIAEGFTVQIETNGTLWRNVPEAVRVVVSPKNTGKGYAPLRLDLAARAEAIKFIISATDPAYRDIGQVTDYPTPIYVQPMDAYNPEANAANLQRCLEISKATGARLSLQLHKLIGIP